MGETLHEREKKNISNNTEKHNVLNLHDNSLLFTRPSGFMPPLK